MVKDRGCGNCACRSKEKRIGGYKKLPTTSSGHPLYCLLFLCEPRYLLGDTMSHYFFYKLSGSKIFLQVFAESCGRNE